MRTLKVYETIKWIETVCEGPVRDFVLEGQTTSEKDTKNLEFIISISHQAGKIATTLSQNPDAVEILETFKLGKLLDDEYLTKIITSLVKDRTTFQADPHKEITGPWQLMTQSLIPWSELIIPDELTTNEKASNLLTLEIREFSQPISLLLLADVLKQIEEVYEDIARVYEIPNAGKLSIVKIESGSNISLHCLGGGEVIKHLKDFIIQVWEKIRYRTSDKIMKELQTVSETLKVIEQIQKMVANGLLSPEVGKQLIYKMIAAVLRLFKKGVTIPEIPQTEIVDKSNILKSITALELPAPKDKDGK